MLCRTAQPRSLRGYDYTGSTTCWCSGVRHHPARAAPPDEPSPADAAHPAKRSGLLVLRCIDTNRWPLRCTALTVHPADRAAEVTRRGCWSAAPMAFRAEAAACSAGRTSLAAARRPDAAAGEHHGDGYLTCGALTSLTTAVTELPGPRAWFVNWFTDGSRFEKCNK